MKELLVNLKSLNISLAANDTGLDIYDPNGQLTENLLIAIENNKAALLNLLKGVNNSFAYEGIPAVALKEHYKLSSVQKRLHFLYELDKDSLAYNISQVIKLEGCIDKIRLQNAFNALIRRHESLRTCFELRNGELVQVIAGEKELEIVHVEARPEEADAIIKDLIRPFALNHPPLFRVALIGIAPYLHLLVVDMHHIITDGVSHGVFLKDLVALYTGRQLDSLTLQYKDYAEWQQREVQQKEMSKQRAFWQNEFLELPVALNLPTDYPRPPVKKYEGKVLPFALSKEDSAKLRSVAEVHGATMFMEILSCYAILLGKLSNQEDIVIGTPVAGRQHADLENMIGMFVNTLPLRLRPEGNLCFQEFLAAVRAKTLACFENQAYQYEELIIDLQVERDRSRNPLFDAMFIYQNFDRPDFSVQDLGISLQKSYHGVSKFDITLIVEEEEDQLVFHFEYNTSLFVQETIDRFTAYFKRILAAIMADQGMQISDIQLIGREEREMLLQTFNQTAISFPKHETIIELFERQVSKTPHHISLVEGSQNITYEALQERVNEFAFYFKQLGVLPGEVIALLQDRSIDCIAGILAVLKVGCTYLPIDRSSPGERIDFVLEDSKARLLFTAKEWIKEKQLQWSGTIVFPDMFQSAGRANPERSRNGASINPSAYIIYTSGSSGKPKGVVGTQQAVINRLYWGWKQFPYAEGEMGSQKTSLNFVDHVAEIYSPLLAGVPQVILSDSELMDPHAMFQAIQKHKISRLTLVPSLLQLLISSKKNNNIRLETLKYVFCSGEPLTFPVAQRFYKEFGHTRLVNIYGSTEVGADVTWYEVDRFNVEDVLQYFKNVSTASVPGDMKPPEGDIATSFTTAHVKVEILAEKFMDSKVARFPLPLKEYYQKLHKTVIPYVVNTASPTFIGHMTSVLPDYVHDISRLISQLNQNLVKIETSKALTFLEREAIARLHRLFYAFPENFYAQHIQKLNANLGIVTSGGSIANISALLSARNKLLSAITGHTAGGQELSTHAILREKGYKDMVLIGSPLLHYSFRKAQSLLGLGTNNIVYVKTGQDGKMCTKDLEEKILSCEKDKLLILAVIGIAGSTETGCIDPLEDIGKVAAKYHIHFHVDAAWGGALIFSGIHKGLIRGIEQADSITFCGHKQLYLPQGISICLFKDPAQLNYNSTTAAYQATADSFDTGRFTIEGSRPGLSMCLHASLDVIGKKGYELLVNNNIDNAVLLAKMINEVAGFQLVSLHINIINYRYIPVACRAALASGHWSAALNEQVNEVNTAIQEYQFYAGRTFVSKTTIHHPEYGKTIVFRAVLSNPLTTRDDLIKVLNDQLSIISLLFGESNEFSKSNYQEVYEEPAPGEYRKIPIGQPLSNTKIYILDKYSNIQPIGVPGEICVSGAGLAKGYIGHAQLTGASFVPNPYQEDAFMYRTGDIGRWLPDGNIEYAGRRDDQVKIRGFRIEPGEIEYQLFQYGAISEATVVAKEQRGTQRLVAYYIADGEINVPDLRQFLAARLPSFMIPSFFIQLEQFPLTPTGKLNKKALRDPGTEALDDYVAPSNEIERELVAIWSEVLGTDRDLLSVNRTFFELGGHSLITPVLLATIDTKLKVSISLPVFFQYPVITALAAHIRSQKEQSLMPGA